MSQRPKRPCAVPMCPNLTTEKYCEQHAHKAQEEKAERQRFYDKYIRDEKASEFYHSKEWQAIRLRALERDFYLCQPCLRERRITKADMVHHIVPIKQDWSRRLDLSNLESICISCHNKIHGNQQPAITPVTLVCGPPGSGKTTYVKERMQPGDLVVDMDAIYSALSGLPWYNKPPELLPFVAAARDAVIERLQRPSNVRHAWVIATAPKKAEREELRRKLQAEVIILDVSAEECKRRIRQDLRRAEQAVGWDLLIDKWWEEYEP